MANVYDVARFFLSKESMSHKKLEKLCYYAQAWYLANHGTPLVNNRFEAWVHGPVSPDLYTHYRDYGWAPIPQVSDKNFIFTNTELDLLEKVYETYGDYTADELEAISHKEIPWLNARKGCDPYEYSRNPISMRDMRNYYGERIKRTYD